jgi:integrase/recombinase XerD
VASTHGEIDISFGEVERVWRENRCLTEDTIALYRGTAQHFIEYCRRHRLQPRRELTYAGTTRFVRHYNQGRRLGAGGSTADSGCVAASVETRSRNTCWAGRRPRTICAIGRVCRTYALLPRYLLRFLRRRRRPVNRVRLIDIDALLRERSRRWSVRTLAELCTAVRCFLRFLYLSGRVKVDLSRAVLWPRVRRSARLPRALPWSDVQRILRGIDRTTPVGRRDYVLLLMMSVYGCGAGEIVRLGLADIDWSAATLRLVRPKTRVEIRLPLLPVVARALSDYLRYGRPAHAPARAVFVRMKPPHIALAASSAVRHIFCRWAARAQVKAAFLGSHALRHAHACRQMELGTRPQLIGDILGHRDPQSTSIYLRVATERLRELALPVPR